MGIAWLSVDSLRAIGCACEIDRLLERILVGTNLT